MADNKPTLHHLNNSQSQRILWLCEELRLASASTPTPFEYNLVLHKRETTGPRKMRSPKELFDIHPLGKAPQIVTPSGRVLVESSTCAKYLLDTYDSTHTFQGEPSSDPQNIDSLRDDMLTSFANASLPIPMMTDMFLVILVQMSPFFIRPLFRTVQTQYRSRFSGPEIDAMFKQLNRELEGKEYFMGGTNPARADFMVSWPVDFASQLGMVDLSKPEYANVKRWHERCKAREGWKSAMEKGNGYHLSFVDQAKGEKL